MGTGRLWRRWACAAGLILLGLVPPSALASGGNSIASAPMLAYGHLEAGGGVISEYWRLPVTQGDHLTFDVDATDIGEEVLAFIPLAPSVDDYTVSQHYADGLELINRGKVQRTWVAPFTGTGTLWVTATGSSEPINPYTFTATVVHGVSLTAFAPTLARAGATITVRGTISSPAGTPQGNCLIAGKAIPVTSGKCSGRVRLHRGHRQTIQISFVGSEGWQSISTHRTIRLIG